MKTKLLLSLFCLFILSERASAQIDTNKIDGRVKTLINDILSIPEHIYKIDSLYPDLYDKNCVWKPITDKDLNYKFIQRVNAKYLGYTTDSFTISIRPIDKQFYDDHLKSVYQPKKIYASMFYEIELKRNNEGFGVRLINIDGKWRYFNIFNITIMRCGNQVFDDD